MRKRFIEGGEIRAAWNSEGLREIGGTRGGGEGEGGWVRLSAGGVVFQCEGQ